MVLVKSAGSTSPAAAATDVDRPAPAARRTPRTTEAARRWDIGAAPRAILGLCCPNSEKAMRNQGLGRGAAAMPQDIPSSLRDSISRPATSTIASGVIDEERGR